MKKGHIAIISTGTLIFAVSFIGILFLTDPESANFSVFVLFYLSFLGLLTGLFSLGLLYLKNLIKKRALTSYDFRISFRRGIFLASLVVGMMWFSQIKFLNLPVVAALILFIILIEYYAGRRS